jgi:chromosome segregation ATPase
MSLELAKAKSAFQKEHDLWEEQRDILENHIQELRSEKANLQSEVLHLNQTVDAKNQEIHGLNQEIEKISTSFSEVESSAEKQNDVLKNLMEVAEGKIVEMKLALDKKSLEAQDYYSHLQQALTQLGVLKQENAALKDYIAKLNHYHQQVQAVQQQALQSQGQAPTN